MKLRTWQPAPAPTRWPLLCVAMFVAAFLMATIVPPFQAPDEFDHSARAYMLSQGQLVLHSVNGSPSGGPVDQGLLEYMRQFTPIKGDASRKISVAESDAAAAVPWAGQSKFVTAVGTAYYFPALYLPEAIGLAIGKSLGMSVGKSYWLSRYLALACCFALLLAAFRMFPPPTLVLALLALPMNLFLLSSAVLDGMATCTAIFALSAFMRLVSDRGAGSQRTVYLLAISVTLVAACRANLLPLLALPFAAWWFNRSRAALVCAIASAVFVLAWTMWTIKFTIYPAGPRNIDHGARLIGYLLHPWEFGRIVFATLTNSFFFHFYLVSFIGVLGWLDAAFSGVIYKVLFGVLALVAIFSVSRRPLDSNRLARGLLVLCSVVAILLTFLAMLVQWTVGTAVTVDGVQGRYFMIPAVIFSYALFSDAVSSSGVAEKCRTALTFILLALSTYVTTQLLVTRYYTAESQPSPEAVPSLEPSQPLTAGRPIALHFRPSQVAMPEELDRIAIRFGTYMSSHPGRAILILRTNSGETLRLPFALPEIADNAYKEFTLDGKRYISGEIVSNGGEGISTYQARTDKVTVVDCMQTRSRDGRVEITTGCPKP